MSAATVPDATPLSPYLVAALSFAPPVATFLCFGLGTTFEDATRSDAGEPLIVPAGYAFIIWGLIYASSMAYGVFQALPAQRESELLRAIGPYMASAFVGTAAWLLMARFGWTWLTVACIVWIGLSLAGALPAVLRAAPRMTALERGLVVLPVSVFAGWVTVATFANTAAAVKESGWLDTGLPEPAWTVVMLLAAGAIAAAVTLAGRGAPFYALTVVWALVGIVVANAAGRSVTVAVTAGALAVAVVALSAAAWALAPRHA